MVCSKGTDIFQKKCGFSVYHNAWVTQNPMGSNIHMDIYDLTVTDIINVIL